MKAVDWFLIGVYMITVLFRAWIFWKIVWSAPLRNGERYFLNVEVPEGWHASFEGRRWWLRYKASIVLPHTVEVAGFVAIAIWGRWTQLPLLAFVTLLFVVSYTGMIFWWSRSTYAAGRRKPQRVAVDLTERRWSEYSSWVLEALALALILASWVGLTLHGDLGLRWRPPVLMTYAVAGLMAIKHSVIKTGWSLPVDRTDAYQHYQRLRRKQGVSYLDRMRWMLIAILTGYACVHSLQGIIAIEQLRWTVGAMAIALWLWMMFGYIRSEREMSAALAGLPPAPMNICWKKGWWPFGIWAAGLAVLMVWPA